MLLRELKEIDGIESIEGDGGVDVRLFHRRSKAFMAIIAIKFNVICPR